MGIYDLAQDVITAIEDVLDEIGDTLTIKYFTEAALDVADPGAGRTKTAVTATAEGILIDVNDSDIDGTVVKRGDKYAIISIATLTFDITNSMFIIDGAREYKIINLESPQVAGNTVVVCAQVRA